MVGLYALLDNAYVFITLFVIGAGAFGMASGSMAIASWGAYMVFSAFAVVSDLALLTNIWYVTLVLIFIGFGFKMWRLEGGTAE